MMRDAIMSAAELAGIKVYLVNPSYSSQEHPISGERSKPGRDRVVRFSDGSEYDRDELAAINMAVRLRRGERAKKNRKIKLRDKHTATPKQLKRKTSRRSERLALVNSIKRANDVTSSDRAHLTVGARPGVAYMPRLRTTCISSSQGRGNPGSAKAQPTIAPERQAPTLCNSDSQGSPP